MPKSTSKRPYNYITTPDNSLNHCQKVCTQYLWSAGAISVEECCFLATVALDMRAA